ncbi:Transposon Tf2-11 polyprotein [Dictyocoela muelleri]|nr:Transposon Tf2-11 polyprotein [Dictyocoela muelleri]
MLIINLYNLLLVKKMNMRLFIYKLYSKKYNKQELNYSSAEKEALAITRSLMHFKPLVYNAKVEILTDNKNLLFKGPLTKRLNRMKLILKEYDYELKHIEGKNNNEADLLSRGLCNIKIPKKSEDYRLCLPERLVHLNRKIREEKKDFKLTRIFNRRNEKHT